MIIKTVGTDLFEAIGDTVVNAYVINQAQTYKPLGRTTFQNFRYYEVKNRELYESPRLHKNQLQLQTSLTFVRNLETPEFINNREPEHINMLYNQFHNLML